MGYEVMILFGVTFICLHAVFYLYRALKALWNYLTQKGVDSEAIWEKIKDIVVKTIIA